METGYCRSGGRRTRQSGGEKGAWRLLEGLPGVGTAGEGRRRLGLDGGKRDSGSAASGFEGRYRLIGEIDMKTPDSFWISNILRPRRYCGLSIVIFLYNSPIFFLIFCVQSSLCRSSSSRYLHGHNSLSS